MTFPNPTNSQQIRTVYAPASFTDIADSAYRLAYRAARERGYQRLPSVDELVVRVLGWCRKVTGHADYQQVHDGCAQALARIRQRAPLTWDGFIDWCRRRGRRSGVARRERTADRDAAICRDRAAGVSAIELAEKHGMSRQQIYNIVARDTGVKSTILPPIPDDCKNLDLTWNSSESLGRDSSFDIGDTSWIADTWQASVGAELEPWQKHQLRAWCGDAEGEYGADLIDLVRIVEYAGRPEIRDPWRYVQAAVERRLGKGPEYRQELEQAAGDTGRRYADYAHVRNRRAYLATCARNAGPPPMDAETRRTGFLDSYRRRHGRLPWD